MGHGGSRRRRLWQWGSRIGAALVCALLAAGLCLVLCLPWLAECALGWELERRGAGNIVVRVQALSWREAVLGPVAIVEADGVLWLESVVIRYDLGRLRQGSVAEVRVVGARLPVFRRGQDWLPVGLETVQRLAAGLGEGADPATAPARFQALLAVRSSQVEVPVAGAAALVVPVEVTARLEFPGEGRLQGSLRLAGEPVTFQASADLATGCGAVAIDCRGFEIAAWAQTAVRAGLPLPAVLGGVTGRVAWQVEARLRGWGLDGASAEVVATDLCLCREPFPVRLREGTVSLRCGPGVTNLHAEFSVQTEAMAWSGAVVEPFLCTGTWAGDALEVAIADAVWCFGAGTEGRLSACLSALGVSALETAYFRLEAGLTEMQAASHGPLAGRLTLMGTPADLFLEAVLETDRPQVAFGLETLLVDGRLRLGEATEIEAAVTAMVWPQVAAAALGAPLQLAGELTPVSGSAALRQTGPGAWECSAELSVPRRRLEAVAGTLRAAAEIGLECRFAAMRSAPPAGPGHWQCSGTVALPLRQATLAVDALRATSESAGVDCRFAVDAGGAVSLSGRVAASRVTAATDGAVLSATELAAELDSVHCQGLVLGAVPSLPALAQGLLRGLTVEARLAVSDGAVGLPGSHFQCEGIGLDLPMAWTLADGLYERPGMAPAADCLRTGSIAFGDLTAAGFAGHCRLDGQAVRVHGRLEGTAPAVTVDLDQTLDWSQGVAATLRYALPAFRLDGRDAWCRGLLAGLGDVGDLSVSGMVAAEGEVTLAGGRLQAPCRVTLAEGTLDWPQKGIAVQGIRLELSLVDVLGVRTAPFQELHFSGARFGDIAVDGGRIVFQLDGPNSCCLLRCDLEWCGGQVHTQAMQFDPARPEIDLVLFAEDVDVVRVLTLIKGFSGRGQGRLYGKLPISYRDGRVSYAKGYLHSLPGETGRLALQAAGLLSSMVGPDHPAYGELQRAEKALEDFRLDLFRLDFTGRQAGEPGAKLVLAGEGVEQHVPVKLNLNIHGAIEEALNVGLRLGGL